MDWIQGIQRAIEEAFIDTYHRIVTEFFPQSSQYEYGESVEFEVYSSADKIERRKNGLFLHQCCYSIYQKNMKQMEEEYGKTPEQRTYLEKQYSKVKMPVTYEAFTPWDTMIMYAETYAIILAIIVGFICAGIFADDFQTKADAVFLAAKYGRTKAVKTKILAGLVTTTVLYWSGMAGYSISDVTGIQHLYYNLWTVLFTGCSMWVHSKSPGGVTFHAGCRQNAHHQCGCLYTVFPVLLTAIYWKGTFWLYSNFQLNSNDTDQCGGKCESATDLPDRESCIPADSAGYGDVYSDCNCIAAIGLSKYEKNTLKFHKGRRRGVR